MWFEVRTLGDKFCKEGSVIFPSICKNCLTIVESYGTKEQNQGAFELLNSHLLIDYNLYFGKYFN